MRLLCAGVAASFRDAVPPHYRMAVSYTDDEVDHEGILVWPVSLVHRFVLQPDDDCWVEDSGTPSWNSMRKHHATGFSGTGPVQLGKTSGNWSKRRV